MKKDGQHKISYNFVEGPAVFDPADLVYVESSLHRCLFHYRNDSVLSTYRKLDDIEALLAEDRMIRIHQSYLINMDYCVKVSNYTLWIRGGQRFSVPRARYRFVKERFVEHRLQKERTDK